MSTLRGKSRTECNGGKCIQVGTKALLEENLAENKGSYLDLIEVAVLQMNGDLQNITWICVSNDSKMNLSKHGRKTIGDNKGISMSEKLRYLKYKLTTTEAVVHSTFHANSDENMNSQGSFENNMSSVHDSSPGHTKGLSNDATISSIHEKLANDNHQHALRRVGSSKKSVKESTLSSITSKIIMSSKTSNTNKRSKG